MEVNRQRLQVLVRILQVCVELQILRVIVLLVQEVGQLLQHKQVEVDQVVHLMVLLSKH